jgi:ribose 5-phosphate isomerase B
MKISIGADHRGYILKRELIKYFGEQQFFDVGAFDGERSDYPIFAQRVCVQVVKGETQAGILICGSGIGMSIAANRYKKIYAALCWIPEVARCARAHDNANVLILPADFVSFASAIDIVTSWIKAPFEGGGYADRLAALD